MDLTFDLGNSRQPRGHALLYFHDRETRHIVATYVIILPIQMDMGKYIPPLLASQFGSIQSGEISAFAAPPLPESVESVESLERLAELRHDDLVYGGDLSMNDIAVAIQDANEAVQAYAQCFQEYVGTETYAVGDGNEQEPQSSQVQHVLYELLSERDRLGELSRLVGTMRFAVERADHELIKETELFLDALQAHFPALYWIERVRKATRDMSENGTIRARLYVERCYKLLDQEFADVQTLEIQIEEAEKLTE